MALVEVQRLIWNGWWGYWRSDMLGEDPKLMSVTELEVLWFRLKGRRVQISRWGADIEWYRRELGRALKTEAWRVANLPRVHEVNARREKLHAALQHEFDAYGGRNAWIWHQHLNLKRTLKSISEQIGLSRERIRNIARQEERRRIRRAGIRPFDRPVSTNKGRPIDMGGPRDIWLTFYPSADPRIDDDPPGS